MPNAPPPSTVHFIVSSRWLVISSTGYVNNYTAHCFSYYSSWRCSSSSPITTGSRNIIQYRLSPKPQINQPWLGLPRRSGWCQIKYSKHACLGFMTVWRVLSVGYGNFHPTDLPRSVRPLCRRHRRTCLFD